MTEDAFAYDAFASYATDPDGQLVRKVEDLIESFHRRPDIPKDLIPELKLCVDGRDFTFPRSKPGSKSSEAIEQVVRGYLRQCRSLIVFCGPSANHHPWINREVEWWDQERSGGAIYFAFTHGLYPDTTRKKDFMPIALVDRGGPDNTSYFDLRGFHQPRKGLGGWLARSYAFAFALLGRELRNSANAKLRSRRRRSAGFSDSAKWRSVRSFDDEACRIAAQLVSDKLGVPLAANDITEAYIAAEYTGRRRRARWAVLASLLVVSGLGAVWISLDRSERERRTIASVQQAQAEIDNGQYEQAMRFALTSLPGKGEVPWALGWDHPSVRNLLAKLGGAANLSAYKAQVSEGDNQGLTSAAFSVGGQKIVTSSESGVVSVWNAKTLKKIGSCRFEDAIKVTDRKPARHKASLNWIRDSQFSLDGERVVSVGPYGAAWIWNADAPDCGHSVLLLGHEDDVRTGAFSPDGRLVVTTSDDDTVRVWDATTGQQRTQLNLPGPSSPPTDYTTSAEFSPDGKSLAITRSDGLIAIADTDSFKVVPLDKGPFAWRARFSRDSKKLAAVLDNGSVWIWDIVGRIKLPLPKQFQPVVDASFSPDGRLLVTASADSSARLWDLTTLTERFVFRGHQKSVTRAEFSPDGQEILTSSADGYARIWASGQNTSPFAVKQHAKAIAHVEISPDGNNLLTVGADQTAVLWDMGPSEPKLVTAFKANDGYVTGAAFHPRGTKLALAYSSGRVSIVGVPDGHELNAVKTSQNGSLSVGFSPSGDEIVVGSDSTDNAVVWDLKTEHLTALEEATRVRSIEFQGSAAVAMGSKGNNAKAGIWELATGKLIRSYAHDGEVLAVHFSPDGTRLATASLDGFARIWGTSTERPDLTLYHGKDVNSARFSRDGSRIVTASGDHTVRVWDAMTGSQMVRFDIESTARDALFTADGTHIVVGSDEGFLEVFDVTWTAKQVNLPKLVCGEKLKGIERFPSANGQLDTSLFQSHDVNPCTPYQ